MEFRTLGNTGLKVGILGLGMEHVTQQHIIPVVHRAIERGMNTIDIMIWLPERQQIFGEAIKGHRDHLVLAGHLGVGEQNGQYSKTYDVKTCRELFHSLLSRLGTDHVDILHISNLDNPAEYRGQINNPGGLLELALQLKEQGKARFIGLSGHNPHLARQIIGDGQVQVLMHPVTLSPIDPPDVDRTPTVAARLDLLHLCASRGVGIVAMKTFAGGGVFQMPVPTPVVQCINYTLAQPAVATIVMGVKTVAELDANLHYLDAADEEKDFTTALAEAQSAPKGACTYCNHCLPCPVVIDIPAVNRILVMAQHGLTAPLRSAYDDLAAKGSDCIECGICEERCPFGVSIIANMQQAAAQFGG